MLWKLLGVPGKEAGAAAELECRLRTLECRLWSQPGPILLFPGRKSALLCHPPPMRVTGSFSLGTEGATVPGTEKELGDPKYPPLVLRRASSLGKVRGKHRTWHIVGCFAEY